MGETGEVYFGERKQKTKKEEIQGGKANYFQAK